MKRETNNVDIQSIAKARRGYCARFAPLIAFAILVLPTPAHASLFHGETLDAIANGISWVVLITKWLTVPMWTNRSATLATR
jgi:hypothetical protein